VNRLIRSLLAVLVVVSATGCATSIKGWIVATRNRQGDVAVERSNFNDASLAYRLALSVAPNDEHARLGLTETQIQLAAADFRESKFDDALAALGIAARYDAQNARLAELRSEIEQAKIKRLIVFSNYPTYKENATVLKTAYQNLDAMNKRILTDLAQFNYTYDTENLSRAIRDTYELGLEVDRNRRRLIAYRELVESGVPANEASAALPSPASLLPLP
jgi:hypothetical protein